MNDGVLQKKSKSSGGGGQENGGSGGGEQENGGGGGGSITVVLKADLHCEGCVSKIFKTIRSYDGESLFICFTRHIDKISFLFFIRTSTAFLLIRASG